MTKTPAETAAIIASRPARELEETDLQELLIEAIEADRTQRTYIARIQAEGYAPQEVEVTVAPDESIVEAVMREGNMPGEWSLLDVEVAT